VENHATTALKYEQIKHTHIKHYETCDMLIKKKINYTQTQETV